MNFEIFERHPKRILAVTYLFAISMIIILHAALTTITTRSHERATNILAQELSENIYSTDHKSNEEALKFIKNYPATKIIIYDNNQQQILVSNDNKIEDTLDCRVMDYVAKLLLPKIEKNLQNALQGEFFSQINWSAKLNDEKYHYSFMKVTSPITMHFNKQHDANHGVVEVYFDITRDWIMYNNTRLFGLLLITIIFFIFYLVVAGKLKRLDDSSLAK